MHSNLFFKKKTKIILGFLILIVYYEIKLYNISICQNICENKNVIVEHMNFFGNDQFLLQLNNKINGFVRFGHEFKNFILYVISTKTQNQIILHEKQIESLQELNK
jgi:hypothetical protein